jgi:light-regulated signal transduction histidine kinase (bacteriophytochrome)
MVDGGQRAQALIRDLLSLARLDSQARPWQAVALDNTLADTLQQLRLRVQETGATVTHDPLPTVLADARQIGQLMANLVGNALKFCGPAAPSIHVSAVREGSGWRISVRDNGIGIEPRYFDRIFQMFQRLHLRSEYDGTGIGLAICKKVVERHGGRIGVESTPGQGATFFFTLPDHAPGHGQAPAPGAASAG